ncbi:MAG: hypothetical protein KAT58_03145 [candidate division Zixibacteria bacterium]|nr:hypothetical protein [candidate division Zixibacteria bacterium]
MKMVRAGILLVVLLGLGLFGLADAYFFGQVCVATGTIRLYGNLVEKGLPLHAYIGDDKVAESLTKSGGRFELSIPQYDASHPEISGYHSPDDIIQVKLSGKTAKPTFMPNRSKIEINLDVEQSLDVKLSTWGKIKALFK